MTGIDEEKQNSLVFFLMKEFVLNKTDYIQEHFILSINFLPKENHIYKKPV